MPDISSIDVDAIRRALTNLLEVFNPLPQSGDDSGWITLGFIILIVSIFGVLLITEAIYAFRLRRFRRVVAKLRKEKAKPLTSHADFDRFAARVAERAPGLAAPLHEFGEATFERTGQLYNSVQFDDFVSQDRFRDDLNGQSLVPPPLVGAGPQLLTALGIFGTFVGLVIGLPTEWVSAAETNEQVMDLVRGLHVAFRSSVYGLLASIIITTVGRYIAGKQEGAYHDLSDEINRRLERMTPQDLLARLIEVQDEGTAALKSLNTDLAPALERALGQAVQTHLAPTFAKLEEHSREIVQASKSLATGAAETQVEGVQNMVNSFTEKLDEAIGSTIRSAAERIESASTLQLDASRQWGDGVSRLTGQVDRFTSLMDQHGQSVSALQTVIENASTTAASFSSAATSIQAAMDQVERSSTELRNAFQEAGSEQRELSRSAVQETTAALQKTIEQLNASADVQGQKVVTQIDAAAQSLRELVQEIETSGQRQSSLQEEAFKNSLEGVQGMVGSLNEARAELIKVTSGLEGLVANGLPQLARAAEAMVTHSTESKEAADRLEQAMESLSNNLDRIGDGARMSRETAEMSQKVTERLLAIGRDLRDSTATHSEASHELRQLVDRLQQYQATVGEIQKDMATSSENLSDANKAVLAALQTAVGSIRDVEQDLSSGLQSFVGKFPPAIEAVLNKFDEELGRGVGKLGSHLSDLDESVTSLEAVLAEATERIRSNGSSMPGGQ